MDGYNGGFEGGEPPPEGRKGFKKIIEIGHVKLKKLITWQKFHEFFLRGFGQIYKNNLKFSTTRGLGAEPPDAREFLWFFTKLSSYSFNFSVNSKVGPQDK